MCTEKHIRLKKVDKMGLLQRAKVEMTVLGVGYTDFVIKEKF